MVLAVGQRRPACVSMPSPFVNCSTRPLAGSSRHRCRRSMSPALAGVNDALAVACSPRHTRSRNARGQQPRLPAGRRHGSTGAASHRSRPGRRSVIAAPVELLLGTQRVEYAARTLRRAVELGARGRCVALATRIDHGSSGAVRTDADLVWLARQSQERDAVRHLATSAVRCRRPALASSQRSVWSAERVNADEAVIAPRADEGQEMTIGRESQRTDAAARIEQQFAASRHGAPERNKPCPSEGTGCACRPARRPAYALRRA